MAQPKPKVLARIGLLCAFHFLITWRRSIVLQMRSDPLSHRNDGMGRRPKQAQFPPAAFGSTRLSQTAIAGNSNSSAIRDGNSETPLKDAASSELNRARPPKKIVPQMASITDRSFRRAKDPAMKSRPIPMNTPPRKRMWLSWTP